MSWSSLYLIFCVTAFCLCFSRFSNAGNNETDRLALLQIKAKITHDPLGITNSWNDTFHFCEWHGVACGHKHKRVIVLDLSSSQLTGSLSPCLGNLSFLRALFVENNSFIGSIPPSLGRLHRLQYLMLFNNSLGGEIPTNLSRCNSLVKLDLGNNKLVGGIPPNLGSLFNLQLLTLQLNKLVGNIPASLGNLSSLNSLSLNSNNLVGDIPDSLGKLNKVTDLILENNKLSGQVPFSIFNLTSLVHITLGANKFEGSLPSDLGIMLPNLKWFSAFSNNFTGSIPISISNMSYLEALQLDSNAFHGKVPLLNKLTQIKAVFLSVNFLGYGLTTDLDFVYSLANSTMLLGIDIYQNNLKGDFPQVICNFTMLEALSIGMNPISGPLPSCIGNLAYLGIVFAHGANLSGMLPMSIGELSQLKLLSLSDNQLSGHLPSSIGNLTQLSNLDLIGNSLGGLIPASIGNCKNMLQLGLSYNNFSGNFPPQVLNLSSSYGLDLSHNLLEGNLPTEVGALVHLNYLDVSHNMLSGDIPTTLGGCLSLQYLSMSWNHFQGAIPSSLATLMGLQNLNLSHNNLSGKVPDFLVKFQLQYLDLSNNNFEGEVPTGGIFSNGTGLSLFGNGRLCGGIPELKLPRCKSINKARKRRESHKMRLIIAALSAFSALVFLVALGSLYAFCCRKRRNEQPSSVDQDSGIALSNVPYQTLLKATNGFSSENLIGSGTYGVVYKGSFDQGISTFAIKKFNLEHKGASKSFMAECEVLRKIRHRNLVKVITACSGIDYQRNDFKALVYEYMVNGSLDDWLHPHQSSTIPKTLTLLQRLDIAVDVAMALEYLHHGFGTPIVHCDLKPTNVLLDDEMVAHVGDFGLAKFLPKVTSSSHENQSSSIGVRGTVGYAPPEYGLGNKVSIHGDIYSFGILLLEMLTGKRPTDDKFKESSSLHSFVEAALPDRLIEILDSCLLTDIVGDETVVNALTLVLEIALSCSLEVPQERPDMKYVAAKLSSIRNDLVGARSRGQRRTLADRQG